MDRSVVEEHGVDALRSGGKREVMVLYGNLAVHNSQ